MNQTPEQIGIGDEIDRPRVSWLTVVSSLAPIRIKEWLWSYQTDVGPADYVLFVDKKAVGVIEAKREDEGFKLTVVEEQGPLLMQMQSSNT